MKVFYSVENNNWIITATNEVLHKILSLDFNSEGIRDIFEEENISVFENGIKFTSYFEEIGAISMESDLGVFEITPITAEQFLYELYTYDYEEVSDSTAWVRLQNVVDGR